MALFDEEWMESELDRWAFAGDPLMCSTGEQGGLTFVCPHSKVVLEESIRNDTDFLAKSNVDGVEAELRLGGDFSRNKGHALDYFPPVYEAGERVQNAVSAMLAETIRPGR
jgi:hypothetical protein